MAEAEALIPRLSPLMSRLRECHAEVGRLHTALQEAQRRVVMAGGVRLDQEFWRSRKAALARLTTEIRKRVGEVVSLGVVPKDLEMGLVDFPFLMGEREVNLCWRLGEREIRYWHGLDEGYAGRQPLP